MSEFEKIQFESFGFNAEANEFGIYFEVEENHMLIDFEEKLRTCDYIIVEKRQAEVMFDLRSKFEAFARQYGFATRWDDRQYLFVCTKEPPWIE